MLPPPAVRALRVALISDCWPPEVNGVARTVHRLVCELIGQGHDVTVIRPRQVGNGTPRAAGGTGAAPAGPTNLADATGAEPWDEILVPGLPVPGYPSLTFGAPRLGALLRRWRRDPPDVVHVASAGPLGMSAILAASRLRLPVTSSFHTNFHQYAHHYSIGPLSSAITALMLHFHARTFCTMVPTQRLVEELRAHGLGNGVVLARGVDFELFSPQRRDEALRASWGVTGDAAAVLHVGRIAAEKNLDLAWKAFQAIRDRHPAARLVLVGDGPQAALLAGRDGVVLAGMRTGHDLAAHYASGDLLLFPSLTETFGNVVTEAMASGLPVVAFDYAAAGEMLRADDNGAPVPLGDEAAFVAAAIALALDPPRRRRLGRQAAADVCGLSWEAVGRRFTTYLAAAVTAGREPRRRAR